MNKYLKWAIVLIIVGALIFLIVKQNERDNQYFNKIELSENNYVRNITDIKYLDTILKVGLDEMNLKNIYIYVRPISDWVKRPDGVGDLKVHIISGESVGEPKNQYLIEIDSSYKGDIINSISHELIHLLQTHSGQLKNSKDYVIWNRDTIYNLPEYFGRGWEIEAREMGKMLEKRIRVKLYE